MKKFARIGTFAVLAVLFSCAASAQESRTLQEDGAFGNWVLPAKVPAPLVLVLHTASAAIAPEDLAYAQMLAREGFVAFAINYPYPDPGGIPAWVAKYENLAAKQPEIADMPWGAVGFSAGGPRAFWMAVGAPSKFKAVVSYYGTYDPTTSPVPGIKTSSTFGSPLYMLNKFNVAGLLLHGAKDTEVPVEMVERMKMAMMAKGMPVEAVIYPNCYHAFDRGSVDRRSGTTNNGTYMEFNAECEADARARTVAWFKTYLK